MDHNLKIKNNVVVGFEDEFVEEIIIPEGIVKIANNAFEKFYGLKKIVFPTSLTCIGDGAFQKCSSLQTIVLPQSLESLGEGAFKECTSLTEVDMSLCNLTQIPYECFYECKKLVKVVFPYSALKVKSRCFTGCKNLVDIQINEGLKVIEDSFYLCSSLSVLYIPSTLIHLEDLSCRRHILKVKTTTEQFEKFRDALPEKCELLKISLNDDRQVVDFSEYTNFEIDGTEIVEYVGNVTDVVIPEGITDINDQAFSNSSIKSVIFPHSLRRIGASAFEQCLELESLLFNDGLKEIEGEAFAGCKNLKFIYLPNSLECIDVGAFSGCKKVENVECSQNAQYAFIDGCLIEGGSTVIESFGHKIPENPAITDIAESAFYHYGYLYVTIPQNIKYISCAAFRCENMERLKIDHDVHIESGAFSCPKLTQLELSSKCSNVEKGAFEVPQNNMLNVFVDGDEIPQCVETCVNFCRYNYYDGHRIENQPLSGSHLLWQTSDCEKVGSEIYPKRNIVCKGDIYEAYCLGHGFTIFESTLVVTLGFTDSRNIMERVENDFPYRTIRLSKAVVDGINYISDISSFDDLSYDMSTYDSVEVFVSSDKLSRALRYADKITLGFSVYNENNRYIEGFEFELKI